MKRSYAILYFLIKNCATFDKIGYLNYYKNNR